MSNDEKIILNGVEYLLKDLPADGQTIAQYLKFIEKDIQAAKIKIDIYETAKQRYALTLQEIVSREAKT